jgi:hypothetical protein
MRPAKQLMLTLKPILSQEEASRRARTSCRSCQVRLVVFLLLWRGGRQLAEKTVMRVKVQFDTISDISNLAVIATQDSGSDYDIFSGSSSSDSESIDGSSGSDA